MSDRSPFRKRTFLVSFLFPYLFILCLPVLISWVIYFNALGLITGEINRADEAILKQIQQSIDSRLRDVEQITTGLGVDSRVVSLMNANSELSAIQHYTNYGLLRDMNTHMLSNRFLDKFYIYFKKLDLVLSTRGTFRSDAFYRQFYGNYALDKTQWQSQLGDYYPKSYFPLMLQTPDRTGNDREIVFAKSIFPYVSNRPEDAVATIFIHLSPSVMDGILNQLNLSEGRSLSIVNSRNELLYSTERQAAPSIEFEALSDGEAVQFELGGEKMTVSSIASEMTDWKYVSVIPSDLFMHKATVIRNWAVFGLMLSLSLGGMLALLFSRKNYGPIRNLLRIISGKSGASPPIPRNEYRFIEDTVSSIVLEKQRLEEKQQRQNHTLRDHFLVRLIKGKQATGIAAEELYESYQIRLRSDHFAVLVFYLDDISHFSERQSADKTREEELVHFIVKNIVEEHVRQHDHNGFVVEVDQFLVCLVNFKDRDQTKQKNEVLEIAEKALRLFEDRFGIICSVGISRVYAKLEDIKLAYEEAIEALEYKLVAGEKSIIHYSDILTESRESAFYGISAAQQNQFANCIRAGDYRNAKLLISEMIGSYATQAPIAIVKINMSALIHLVMTSLDSISVILDKQFLERLDSVDRLLRCKTLKQLDKEIAAILDEIERYAVETDNRNKNTLIEEIIAFVQDDYPDPNLSVSMIGDHFNVSLPYLSKMFKHHMGEGLLEYIHKVRIEKAKEMIVAGKVTVKEASELVGYTHRDTFIRLFKKYEGVTPGKFKG